MEDETAGQTGYADPPSMNDQLRHTNFDIRYISGLTCRYTRSQPSIRIHELMFMEYPQNRFRVVKLNQNGLIGRKQKVVLENTLFYQLEVLKKTGRYDAFKLQWHPSYDDPPTVWPIPNHLFWDSDIAKWIEGACCALDRQPISKIDDAVKDLVAMIQKAQQPDGYINIHYTVVEPGKRFTNLRDFHELYNAGHLIEAALAHRQHYRNNDFLDPILRYVDLLCKTFGPSEGQIHGYPGHPEIELALLRLYYETKNPQHLQLAKYFISERGNPTGDNGKHFYMEEAERRGDDPNKTPIYYPEPVSLWYYQAHQPIKQQPTIEGHSVRAMYLLTAAADLIRCEEATDNELSGAIYRLWNNMVERKMYITGGIGAMKQWEGFGLEYFLPQSSDEGGCYAETCAAIGVMMLAERLLRIDLQNTFSDTMELCLYNAVLTAMSCDGIQFSYVNQLASSDQDPSGREKWFKCACCPPNVLRLLGQIGGYIFSWQEMSETQKVQLNIHLFIASSTEILVGGRKVSITQDTDWPWSGRTRLTIDRADERLDILLRIPNWAESWEIIPALPAIVIEKGYLRLPGSWLIDNPVLEFNVPLIARIVVPHPLTNQDTLTIMRGPLVYCVEDVDNPWVQDHFSSTQLDPKCRIEESVVQDNVTQEKHVALKVTRGSSTLPFIDPLMKPFQRVDQLDEIRRQSKVIDTLHFIPYYFRANRGGRGQLRVGLKRWIR